MAIVAFLCFAGCTDQEDVLPNNPEEGSEVIVLRERDKNHPLTDYEKLKPKPIASRADLTLSDFVGRSFKLEHYPYENAQNLGFPIIDMDKYLAAHPAYYQSVPVKESFSNYESFSGFERYDYKIQRTKTVGGGFQLNLGIIKIGAKKSYKNVFKSSDTQLDNNVFGELNIKFYDRKYELLLPNLSGRIDYYRKYIHRDFVDLLYYSSTDELLKYYGGFVLTKFLSGGQATALYMGRYLESSHDEDTQKETNLNTEISATIDLEPQNTRSSMGFPIQRALIGRPPGSDMSYTAMFSDIKFSLKTLGGIPAYSQFTIPKDVNSTVFDISSWSRSLENSSNLTIAELIDESLIPITAFVEEDNLKEAFYAYYKNGLNPETKYMQEPHIKLHMIGWDGIRGLWATSLVTRYGDDLFLGATSIFREQFGSFLYEEADRISALFPGLKVLGIPSHFEPGGSYHVIYRIENNEFDTSNMSKFIDSATGKIYLLTTEPQTGEKLAYTLYDEYVISDYIFEDLIDRLPINNNVTLKSIRNQYRLIAL